MRQELKTKVLKRNRIRCKNCGDIIESKHRHDFVTCSCGNVHVDGGLAYLRVGWPGDGKDPSDYFEDLCEYEEVTVEMK